MSCQLHPDYLGLKRPARFKRACESCWELYYKLNPLTHLKCKTCLTEKSVSEFPSRTSQFSGITIYRHRCNACSKIFRQNYEKRRPQLTSEQIATRNARQSKWRKNNPEKSNASRLKYKFNISLDELKYLKETLDYKCAICHQDINKLCIDHDHKTEKVRGLLCSGCNFGIAFFKDNIENLENAITYLQCNFSQQPEKLPKIQELLRQKKQLIQNQERELAIIDAHIQNLQNQKQQLEQEIENDKNNAKI